MGHIWYLIVFKVVPGVMVALLGAALLFMCVAEGGRPASAAPRPAGAAVVQVFPDCGDLFDDRACVTGDDGRVVLVRSFRPYRAAVLRSCSRGVGKTPCLAGPLGARWVVLTVR